MCPKRSSPQEADPSITVTQSFRQVEIIHSQFPSVRYPMLLDSLIPERVLPHLKTQILGRTIRHYERAGSTNDIACQMAREGEEEGTLVLAEEQSRGRGRLGRVWLSERSAGIYASLILRPQMEPRYAPMLNLAAAIAVSDAIREVTGLTGDIKWPNDILVNGRKCCGILTELSTEIEKVQFVIVGIGINVNQKSFPGEIGETASSLFLEAKREIPRIELLVSVLENFEALYGKLLKDGRAEVLRDWMRLSSFACGKKLTVDLGGRKISGITAGLGEDGSLLVKMENGQQETVLSGDIVTWESTANAPRY